MSTICQNLLRITFATLGAAVLVAGAFHGCGSDPTAPTNNSVSFRVSDPNDAQQAPDFKSLTVEVGESSVTITVALWEGFPSAQVGDFIYLYGTYHDMIVFDSSSYSVRRDLNADGYFELLLTNGSVQWQRSGNFQFRVSRTILTDIDTKRVWGYSMASQDRIPNSDFLNIELPR